MNPANFNVGGGMPGGAMPQMQMPQNNEGAQQMVLSHVVQALQSQNFPGWKKDIPIQERAMKIYQM